MKRSPLKRKKAWLREDGVTPKRGYTKAGKPSLTTLTTKADNLARKACHLRGYCEAAEWVKLFPPKTNGGACGGGLQWCHIVGRRHKKVRWSPLNCLCMCAQCHAYYTDHSAEFGAKVEAAFPGRLEALRAIDADTPKPDPEYWIGYYKERL